MSAKDQIRIGLVGVGRIGRMHGEILSRSVPGARLVAVHDAAATLGDQVARDLHVELADSVEQLVSSDDVDAIGICSPTGTHVDVIEAAARAGKAVLCEKPLAGSLLEADQAISIVDSSGIPFMVGFNRRFDPGHQSVRDAIADGSLGDVHLVRISSRDPEPPSVDYLRGSGGIFVDMAVHDLDMARYIAGSPVVQVYAQGAVLVDPAIGELGDVDTAVTMLTHENRAITVIDNSRRATYGYDQRVEAFGALGMAVSGNRRVHNAEISTGAGTAAAPLQRFFIERYAESYQREWAAFVELVRTGGPSPVPVRDGRAPLVLAEAAGESMRRGVPVGVDGG